MSRTHVIHANNGKDKPMCNVKKWQCLEPVDSIENVECKFCLDKIMKEHYCCKNMKDLDINEIIDYCPGNLTTLDLDGNSYPIYFCPFCGKKIEGCKEFVKKLKDQCKGIEDGTIETISKEEFFKDSPLNDVVEKKDDGGSQ